MKSLKEFKTITEEEKTDYSKFDALVRAGLANKAQIQRLHKILDKMGDERPQFNNADKAIVQNLFNKMIDLISNNKQIYQTARRVVREEEELDEGFQYSSIKYTSDYKLSSDGRKVRGRRFKIGDTGEKSDEEQQVKEAYTPKDPPYVLLLKRKAYRIFPDGTRVALYYNKQLDKHFTIPYGQNFDTPIQAEEVSDVCSVCGQTPCNCTHITEAVMDQLHKIVDSKSAQRVKFGNGQTRKVDHYTASAITQVHKALNDDNKKKFADMVHKSPEHLIKASDFAFKHAK